MIIQAAYFWLNAHMQQVENEAALLRIQQQNSEIQQQIQNQEDQRDQPTIERGKGKGKSSSFNFSDNDND